MVYVGFTRRSSGHVTLDLGTIAPATNAVAGVASCTAAAPSPEMVSVATATASALGPMMVNTATASASALNPPMFARASTGTTAAAYGPTVISGGIAPAGVAQATAAAIVAPMITAQAIRAMATANSAASHLYFGSSRKIYVSNDVRVYYVPVEPRTLQVGRS